MNINKLIDQIGGRDRLESIVYAMGAEPCDADPILDSVTHGDIGKMASALLEVLDVKAIGEVRLGDYCEDGTRPAMVACLHDQADWENFADGTKLYTSPPAASVPDALKNFKDAMHGIGHIKRTIEETFGGIHGTHCEPDVLIECKQICDAIYSAYRATSGGVN